MKNSYYVYAVLGIIVIVLAVVLFQTRPSAEEQAMQACIDAGGTFDAGSQSCSPAPVASVASVPAPTVSATKSAAAVAPITHNAVVPKANPALPTYYTVFNESASTTLDIRLTSPGFPTVVASPLTISGQARGSWFSSQTFPILLLNSVGTLIAQGSVTAQADWQIPDFVPFTGTLTFPAQPSGSSGTLVFEKDVSVGGQTSDIQALEMAVTFR